jgi:hypothetical protein
MASRHFTDSNGVIWRVWSTIPDGANLLGDDYARGWLTFESEDALRRLVPIPTDWEQVAQQRLELYCRVANEVPRHTGPFARLRMDADVVVEDRRSDARP